MDAMTIKQAAAKLGVHPDTVYSLCQERRLAFFRIGRNRGTIRISSAQLDDYLKSTEVPAQSPQSPGSKPVSRQAAPLLPASGELARYRKKISDGSKRKTSK